MKKDDFEFVRHILESIDDIENCTKDLSKESFIKNKEKINAVLRSLTVIGEATKNLSQGFRDGHRDVNWKELAGVRDILVHQYFAVDLDAVWGVINIILPQIKTKIKKLQK